MILFIPLELELQVTCWELPDVGARSQTPGPLQESQITTESSSHPPSGDLTEVVCPAQVGSGWSLHSPDEPLQLCHVTVAHDLPHLLELQSAPVQQVGGGQKQDGLWSELVLMWEGYLC